MCINLLLKISSCLNNACQKLVSREITEPFFLMKEKYTIRPTLSFKVLDAANDFPNLVLWLRKYHFYKLRQLFLTNIREIFLADFIKQVAIHSYDQLQLSPPCYSSTVYATLKGLYSESQDRRPLYSSPSYTMWSDK